MSTAPQPQAAFIQGNQGTMEQDATQSTILYLRQEASKLASPAHNSLLVHRSPPTWPRNLPRQDPFMINREAKDPHSFNGSHCSSQHRLSHMTPYSQSKTSMEDSHNQITASVESSPQYSSPWRVLSLINLQCERLLHDRDLKDSDLNLKSTNSTASSSASAADVTDQGCRGDIVIPECPLEPTSFISEREENTGCNSRTKGATGELRGDCSEGSSGFPVQCRVNSCKVGSIVHPQSPEKIDTVRLELVDKNTTAYSSEPAHRDKTQVKFNVFMGLEWKEDSEDMEQDITCSSNEDASVALYPSVSTKEYPMPKPVMILDFNSNLTWTVETPFDTQMPSHSSLSPSSQSAIFSFRSEDGSHMVLEEDDKITASEPDCRYVPKEEKYPLFPQMKSPKGETNPPPPKTSKPECIQIHPGAHPFPQQCSSQSTWRTKTPRKQPHPSRSADIQDPDFQGVTFRMETVLDDSREQCRLLITSKYR